LAYLPELLFVLLALASEVLGTVAGFGSSVFFVPLAQLLFGLQVVLVLTALLHVVGNTAKVVLFRKHIQWQLLLRFAVPGTLCTIVGAWLTNRVELPWIEAATGVFLIVLSGVYLLKPAFRIAPTTPNAVAIGAASGFLTGLTGTGGAVRAAGLAGFSLQKELFVATSAAIDWGNDAARATVYLVKGYLTPNLYMLLPILLLTGVAGSWLGKRLLQHVSQQQFRRLVVWLVLCIGVFTLVRVALQRGWLLIG
jgi:hypothetical protein